MMAAYFDYLDVLQFLLDRRIDINATEHIGDTALILAAQQGSVRCVRELIKRGANKDHVNIKGQTALDKAKFSNHDLVIRILMQEDSKTENLFFPVTSFQFFTKSPDSTKIAAKLREFNETTDPGLQLMAPVMQRLLQLGDPSFIGNRLSFCNR